MNILLGSLFLQVSTSKEVEILTKQVEELARANKEIGISNVNSSAFIIISLFIIVIFGAIFGILIRSLLVQQKNLTKKVLDSEDLLNKFQISFDNNTAVLDKVNNYLERIELLGEEQARREATSSQLHYFMKDALNSYKYKLLELVLKVIRERKGENWDTYQERAKEQVKVSILNISKNFLLSCNSFHYKEKSIGDELYICVENAKENQLQFCLDWIKNNSKFDGDMLERVNNKFTTIFDGYFYEIKSKIGF